MNFNTKVYKVTKWFEFAIWCGIYFRTWIAALKTLWPDCAYYLIFQGPSEPIFVTNNDKLDNWKILQSHHRISNSENVGSELELNSSKLHELNLKSFQNWLFVWLLTIDLINLSYCLAGNKVCLEKKLTTFVFGLFTTISGHFYSSYPNIFHKI